MTLFKLALKSIRNNKILSGLSLLQMSALIVIVCVMVSSLCIRYESYKPFSEFLNSKGFIVCFNGPAMEFLDSSSFSYMTEEVFSERLSNAEKIVSCYQPMLVIGNESEGYLQFRSISMDDELISDYIPEIENGKWLSLNSEEIEAVVTQNNYGWKAGDVISAYSVDELGNSNPRIVPVKIVGVLKEPVKIPFGNSTIAANFDYNQIYYPYSLDIEQEPMLIFSYSGLKKADNIPQNIGYLSFVTYNTDVSDEKINIDMKEMDQYGSRYYERLDIVNRNSIIYLQRQLYELLPIVLLLMVLTAVSTCCCSALSARRRLYDYAIFYIVGSEWKQCAVINLVQSLIIALSSNFVSLVFLLCALNAEMLNEIKLIVNIWLVLSVIFLNIFYLLISVVMPLIIIGGQSPKNVLTQRG